VQNNNTSVVHCFRTPVGGLFRHVQDLVRGQAAAGFDVGVICDSTTGGPFADESLAALEEVCELGVLRLPIHRLPHPGDLPALAKAWSFCRARRPEVIHGHGAKGGSLARILGALTGASAVYTPHGGALHYDRSSMVGFCYLGIERLLARYTQGYIFESEFGARQFAAKVGDTAAPQRIVHNGLDDSELNPVSPAAEGLHDFVFIGELRALKGVDTLLDAIAIIRPERRLSVLIAGAGPDAVHFQDKARALGLEDSVTFSPPIYPATRAFEQGRCLVVPSWAESFPYIVLEAGGAAIPMLTTRVGGIPEIYGPLSDRLLPPQDPPALAAAMLEVLNDLAGAAANAEQLHMRIAGEFRIERMVREISEFYGSLQLGTGVVGLS
jgi:glycosyltransferase involved in cell wall biosynthesis